MHCAKLEAVTGDVIIITPIRRTGARAAVYSASVVLVPFREFLSALALLLRACFRFIRAFSSSSSFVVIKVFSPCQLSLVLYVLLPQSTAGPFRLQSG